MVRKLRLVKLLKQEEIKEKGGKMINYLKQFEDYNIKDILIQEFQGTRAIKLKLKSTKSQKKNTHKIPQYTIVKPHVRAVMKTKDCCDKKGGSTNEKETYQMKERTTNRQGIQKYDHYSQNDN